MTDKSVGLRRHEIYLAGSQEALRQINQGNSKSRYRKDLLFLDATDRVPVRTEVEQVHTDKAAVDAEAVGVFGVRSR